MIVLTISSYPFSAPSHGGQLRLNKIVETYHQAGFQVTSIGVLGSNSYPHEKGFESYPESEIKQILSDTFLMEDYAIGKLYAENDRFFFKLINKIEIIPDVIHVEQPWLFEASSRYASTFSKRPLLIYGSQNIESQLKRTILQSCFSKDLAEKNGSLVEIIEKNAISQADGIICVSNQDREWIESQIKKPIILSPNGVSPWLFSDRKIEQAKLLLENKHFALYCASAHPPNIEGFFSMLSGGFGSLSPDEILVIAGSAGPNIKNDKRIYQSANLASRVQATGVISQDCLEGLLSTAHCIILPLTQGGGTNLKTAEALWAGKHIVATSIAMRGFEKFKKSPGVIIADTPRDFKQVLRQAMALPPLVIDEDQRNLRREVLWEETLRNLPAFVKSLKRED